MVTMKLDDEIAAVLAASGRTDQVLAPPVSDLPTLRVTTDEGLQGVFSRMPETPSVRRSTFEAIGQDGAPIPLIWYEKEDAAKGPAVIYAHGGGMICGSAAIYDPLVRYYVELSGVSFLSVDYRLAPEFRDVGLARDMLAALRWLRAEAATLGIDPERIALMGDSGGGGVAAAASLMARDEGIPLARQILVYPMLDDRNLAPDPLLAPTASWTYEKNRIAWQAVLGTDFGTDRVSPVLAPARSNSLEGVPSTYIEVGELDIFRDECVTYAQRLHASGVSCELHVLPGAPHGYDWIDLDLRLSRQAFDNRTRVLGFL